MHPRFAPTTMRLLYPASFAKLLLLGFALMALPLALALIGAFLSLDRLGQRSAEAITLATAITRDSRALGEHLQALERLARHQLILEDRGPQAYALRRESFKATLSRLTNHAERLQIDAELQAVSSAEARVWQNLQPGVALEDLEASFASLQLHSERIVRLADERIEANIALLREQSAQARHTLLWQLWALLPIGLLLASALVQLIRRPIRQLERGIRNLGDGRFEQTISVEGPRDLQLLGQHLDWLRRRLAALDAQKTRFLQHISHELKTPLTALHEGTALLSEQVSGPLSAEQQDVVAILRSNCQRLRQLIENLLDYSSIRFQPAALQRGPVALDALIDRVLDDQRLAIQARSLHISTELTALQLQADSDKLRVVIDNLISNAVKFAPPGSTISLRSHQEGGLLNLSICDLGPGIPEGEASALFEPFVQGTPPPGAAAIKGSGLGLAIVRELVGAHGGEVSLHPNSPSGTCACIRLPLDPTPAHHST